MPLALLRSRLTSLSELAGVRGVAIVDSASGMVIEQAGTVENLETLAEAAIEFWRLSGRLRTSLSSLDALNAAALSFARGMLLLQPLTTVSSERALILVAIVTTEQVDWQQWNQAVTSLSQTAQTV